MRTRAGSAGAAGWATSAAGAAAAGATGAALAATGAAELLPALAGADADGGVGLQASKVAATSPSRADDPPATRRRPAPTAIARLARSERLTPGMPFTGVLHASVRHWPRP